MRQQRSIRVLICALLASSGVIGSAASAEELTFTFDANAEYKSNVLGSDSDEIDSFVTHIGPDITVKDPYGRLTYKGRYFGDFTWYADAKNLDGYEQYFNIDASYALSRQTTISVSESFRDLSSIRFAPDEAADLADTLDGGRDHFIRSIFGASLDHSFTRRIFVNLSVSNELLDYSNDHSHTDSTFMGTTGSLYYLLTRQDTIGAGGGFTYQKYEAAGNNLASQGRVWNSFVTWIHKFDSDMKLTLQGGPSVIESTSSDLLRTEAFSFVPDPVVPDAGAAKVGPCTASSPEVPGGKYEDSCGTLLVGTPSGLRTNIRLLGTDRKESDLTFFGKASLVRRWEDWEFRASYTRQQSGASGDDGTSILDRFFVSANYDVDRLWSFYITGGWSQRERIRRPVRIARYIVIDSGFFKPRTAATTTLGRKGSSSNTQYNLIFKTKRRLTKHVHADASFAYRHQIRKRPRASTTNAEYFIVGVSLSYEFDPVRF